MKKINNHSDLRYRKLWLRSEIRIKEHQITSQISNLRSDFSQVNIRQEVVNNIVNNPATLINTAKITFQLISAIRSRRQRNKAKKLKAKGN
jgi:DNA-binding winged helix-turn-helix (wHTH) protein